VSQILINPVANSIKFTDDHGVVEIRIDCQVVSDDEIELSISVADSGIGISPEAQRRIFEEFRQAEQSTTRRYGGSGLGLTIAKRLAELMGGDLGLSSVEGRGAHFRAAIKCRTSTQALVEPKKAKFETSAPKLKMPLTILVAEDNPVNFHLVRKILEKRGHQIFHANNGREVIEYLEKSNGEVSLVIMDCQMPEVDGFEATRLIRESGAKYAQVPIVALTANAFPSDRARCPQAGMNAYISKPFDHGEFVGLVEGVGSKSPSIKGEV